MKEETGRRIKELPAGWKTFRIDEIAKVRRGASPRPISFYLKGTVPWIKIADITKEGKCLTKTEECITEEGAKMSLKLPVGSIIISNSGTIGQPCILKIEGCIHDGFLNIYGYEKYLLTEYLYYFILAQKFELNRLANFGGIQKNLNTTILSDLIITVPPISEQQQIVNKFDKQMAQIEIMKKETDEQRAVLDVLFESIINKEIQVLKSILLDKYKLVKLEDICDMRTGGTPPKSQPEFFGGDIKWIVSGDVNKEFIYDVDGRITEAGYKNSNAKMLPKDSVLIALNGQGKTRGMAAILKTEATCNQSIIAFTPKNKEEFDHVFLFYYLKGSYQKLRNLTGDKERSGLSMSTLRPFQVIAPSIDIQRKVSDKLQRKYDDSILNEVFGQYQINS